MLPGRRALARMAMGFPAMASPGCVQYELVLLVESVHNDRECSKMEIEDEERLRKADAIDSLQLVVGVPINHF